MIYNHLIPKVLVGVVTYDGKDYCKEEFEKRLNELTYENYKPFTVWTNDFKGNSRERITKGYNIVLEEFRLEGYDYLLTLEADIIPPKYIIEALMDYNKKICSATYMIGFKNDRHPCIFDGSRYKRKIKGRWESFLNTMNAKELNGELIHAPGGSGLGCCLIHKDVFKKVKEFRHEQAHCDTYFHQDAQKEGFKSMVDTGIICKHYGTAEEWQEIIAKDF
tara:strand:+ start:54 stop:713 length:660 start_codon:yes stop_codon:yes gene_type:complete